MSSSLSTVRLQDIADIAQDFGYLAPQLNVPQSVTHPAIPIANDVMSAICAVPFPWKWNEMKIPPFYTNSFQQDYAGIYLPAVSGGDPTLGNVGQSVMNLSWLERGIAINVTNTAEPKPWKLIEVGRSLGQQTGNLFLNSSLDSPMFLVNAYPNYMLYFGTWGAANFGTSTLGNNPVSGSIYTNPLTMANSMPSNPISQIRDSNGNLLVITGYGTEGTTPPVAPANSPAGTLATPGAGATTQWTVVDPNGWGFRIVPAPSQTGVTWQFNIVGQMTPVRFTSLAQTLAPLPDEYEPFFRQGFMAQCHRYSPEAKVKAQFQTEWALWLKALMELRAKDAREQEEYKFVPERGITGGSTSRFQRINPQWPFPPISR